MTSSPKDYAALFGGNLRAARLQAGLKQSDMAKRTGFSLAALSSIEHGGLEVTIQIMATLAEAVGRPLPTLLEAR